MKQTKVYEEHHHHYDEVVPKLIIGLFLFLIGVLIVTSTIDIGRTYLNRDVITYNKCTSSCSEKHFMGYALGDDTGNKFASSKGTEVKIYNPTVNEFDRTDCLSNCNMLLLNMNRGR